MSYTNPEDRKTFSRNHYRANKAVYLARARKNWAVRRQVIIDAKTEPCMDCGKAYPHYVMDLDHVRGKKVRNVSGMIKNCSVKRIKKEIAKCDLVCSNCHRERTQKQVRAKFGPLA